MNQKSHSLRIERLFDAPREVVFAAWSEPEQLRQWYHFNDEWKIAEVKVDFRVGGQYRIGWKAPDGGMWYELGEFREIRPPERLVHTCRFDFPDFDEDETLVTIEFQDEDGRTKVTLVQEGYRHAEHRDNHQQGWSGFFDQLVQHLRR